MKLSEKIEMCIRDSASVDQKQKDGEKEYIGQVALFAARYAYPVSYTHLSTSERLP